GEFTAEYGVKAIYGRLIGFASATTLGAADLEIKTVVAGLDPRDPVREPRIKVLGDLGGGRAVVVAPRLPAHTGRLVRLGRRGRDVAEIAGNRRILVTVLATPAPLPALAGVRPLFELPVQSKPGRRRVGLDVDVAQLAASIRAIEQAGGIVEHVYDY